MVYHYREVSELNVVWGWRWVGKAEMRIIPAVNFLFQYLFAMPVSNDVCAHYHGYVSIQWSLHFKTTRSASKIWS